jgi:hypothetical protein
MRYFLLFAIKELDLCQNGNLAIKRKVGF